MNMKKHFEQGMLSLLERKSIDSITVSEIIEEVGSCKGTFYKHYIDKYHLCYQSLQNYIYCDISKETKSWEEFVLQCLSAFEKHDKVILHAFDSEDINSAKNYYKQLLAEFFVKEYAGGEENSSLTVNSLAINLYCTNVTELTIKWLAGGCKEKRKRSFASFARSCPRQYLRSFSLPSG